MRVPRESTAAVRAVLAVLGVAAACGVAFVLRSIGWEGVFLGHRVLLETGDGQYHARLALYTLVNYPRLLLWDGYLNYPDGAAVPAVPLIGFAAATVARLLGGGVHALESVLAWWSPVTGALTPVPVYLAARRVSGRGVAVGAAFLVAALPVLATECHVGNADHTSLQVLLGATLLWLDLELVSPRRRRLEWVGIALGLAAVRCLLVLIWTGSLLYVILGDGLLLMAGTLLGRRDVFAAELTSLLLSAAILTPVVLSLPAPASGTYSAVSLSHLHLWALWGAAAVAGVLFAAGGASGRWRLAGRLALLLASVVTVAAGALLMPGPRRGLLLAAHFLGATRQTGDAILELMPLLPVFGRPVAQSPEHYYGWLAWLVPLTPLAPLLSVGDPRRRAAAWLLAAWTAVLAFLAVWQARFGGDFSPAGSIAFALLIAAASKPLAREGLPSALRPAVAVGAALLLLAPSLRDTLPGVARSVVALSGDRPSAERVLESPTGSLSRFLTQVRDVTPETSGFLKPGRPEYGILCRPRIGHALHYLARRASPADGLLYTAGARNFEAALRFFRTRSESEAVEISRRLGVRYVISMYFPGIAPRSMEARLQVQAGLGDAEGEGRLEHFRLITEGPPHGTPLSDLIGFPRPQRVVAYRLFERVEGALLSTTAPPGTPVSAELALVSPLARSFRYVAHTAAGPDGVARLRVPYATSRTSPTKASGSYHVTVGDRVFEVAVSDEAVLEGREISVGGPAAGDPQKASKSMASKRTRAASRLRPSRRISMKVRSRGAGRRRAGRSA